MSKKIYNIILALLPFLVVVLLYELLPLASVVINSFQAQDGSGFSIENFQKVFTTPLYTMAIKNSLKISIVSAIIGIIVAFIGARAYEVANEKMKKGFTLVLNMTSNFSGVPLAFAFMIIMGNTGVFTTIGKEAGISWLANFDLYTGNGLTLIYIYFQIPLATLLLIPAFTSVKREWKEAAMLLQAMPYHFWTKIGIPVLAPSILGTLSILFSNALAAYATAYALVSSNYALLPIQITGKFKGDVKINAELGGALSVVMIALMVVVTVFTNKLTKKYTKGGNQK